MFYPTVKMAEKSKNSFAQKLFTNTDGTPMIFFMRPCNERQEIRPIIEREGGTITSKVTQYCIKLAEKGSLVSREGYISTTFVEDSVGLGKLQDVQQYKVAAGTRVRHASNQSGFSFSSNDSMSPAPYIVQTSSREYKGRTKYTMEEDIAIMTFLITDNRYNEAHGKKVWKEMEILKVTDHTAESMSARYRKTILPNIDRYKTDIDHRWISRLTGVISTEKEPEFSCEVLFQPRKKKRVVPDSTTNEQAPNSDQQKSSSKDQASDFEGAFGDGDSGNKTGENKNARLTLSNINAFLRTKQPLQFVDTKSSRKQVQTDSSRTKGKNTDVNKQNIESKTASSAKKNTQISEENIGTVKGNKTTQQMSAGHKNIKLVDKRTADVVDSNVLQDETPIEIVVLEDGRLQASQSTVQSGSEECFPDMQSIHLSFEDQTQNDQHTEEYDQQTEESKETDSDITLPNNQPDDDLDFGSELSENVRKRKKHDQQRDRKRRRVVSNRTEDNKDEEISEDSDVHLVTSSNEILIDSQESQGGTPADVDDIDRDSFDEMLEHYVSHTESSTSRAHNKSDNINNSAHHNISDRTRQDNNQHNNQSDKRRTRSSMKADQDQSKTSSSIENTGRKKNADSGKTLRGSLDAMFDETDDDEDAGGAAVGGDNGEPGFDVEDGGSGEVAAGKATCSRLGGEFDLPTEFVRQLLYRCSGDVLRTRAYIKYGPNTPMLQPWCNEDDRLLQENKDDPYLLRKYGADDLKDRYDFLN